MATLSQCPSVCASSFCLSTSTAVRGGWRMNLLCLDSLPLNLSRSHGFKYYLSPTMPNFFSNLDFLPELLAYIYNCILISPPGCLTCPTLTLDISPKLASPTGVSPSQLTSPAIQPTSKNIESSCILLFLPHLILHEKIL